jgi:choice-of-anchor A domain-containing protein
MKKIISFLLMMMSFNSFAEDGINYLSQFAVYTNQDIRVKCSDFLGNVAAGNDAFIDNFLINHLNERSSLCPLNVKNSVVFRDGAVSKGKVETNSNRPVVKGPMASCISAGRIYTERVSYFNPFGKKEIDFSLLSDGLQKLELKLRHALDGNEFQVIELTKDSFFKKPSGHQDLYFKNDGRPILIVSFEQEFRITHTGVFFSNETKVDPSRIFWYFPNASYINIFRSGISSSSDNLKNLGIPGVLLAPKANVNFNEALITGAIYADSLTGGSLNYKDFKTCDLSAGQINSVPFDPSLFPVPAPMPIPQEQDQRVPTCRGRKCS